ncbi:MAG: hypothetical protein ACEQSA_00790 [Weeksellaceae bacterium]
MPGLYFLSFVVAYLVGFFIKDMNLKKFKKFIVDKSIVLALILLILALLPIFPSDYEEAIQQAMFTFASVYVAFWLAEQAKIYEEKRRLKLYLGLLWQEHRFNLNRLEEIKTNYRFTFELGDLSKEDLLQLVVLRFSNIKSLIKKLKSTIYSGFIISGSIVSINQNHFSNVDEADSLFNSLETTYNNLDYLESMSETIFLDFRTKIDLHKTIIAKFDKNTYIDMVLEDMRSKVDMIAKEIAIAYRGVKESESMLNNYLNSLNVTVSEIEKREDILTEEDKNFIKTVNRVITKEEMENPFKVQ